MLTMTFLFRAGAALGLIGILAACASDPHDIAGRPIDASPYAALSCGEIFARYQTVNQDLDTLSAQQSQKRVNDTIGVMLTFLPVNSMTSEDLAPKIADLKGRKAALEEAAASRKCTAPK